MAAMQTNVFLATGQYSVLPRMTTMLQTGRYQSHTLSTEFLAKSKKLVNYGIVGKTQIRVEVTRCSSSTKDDGHDPHEDLSSLESQMALAREELHSLIPDDADLSFIAVLEREKLAGLSIIDALEREKLAAGLVAERKFDIKEFLRVYGTKNKKDWPIHELNFSYIGLVRCEKEHFFELFHVQEVAIKHSGLSMAQVSNVVNVVTKMMEMLHSIVEYHKEEHSSIMKNN